MSSYRFHQFDSLPSTQVEARRGVENGEYTSGDVIIAARQTAGYGRRGRAWQSPSGNMSLTFVADFADHGDLNWMAYAVGLALYDAVRIEIEPKVMLQLKWPNDLLLDGGKLAGLLLEVCGNVLLVGIGMNMATLPDTDQKVVKLDDYISDDITPSRLAARFFDFYTHWHSFGKQGGFALLRDAWLTRAAFLGQVISARLANGHVLTGRFDAIDGQGALVLTNENGHHVVTAADIYL